MQKRISQALKHNDKLLASFKKLKDRQGQLEQQRTRIQNSVDEMMKDDPHYKKIVAKLNMADAKFNVAVAKMLKIEYSISKKLQQE